MPRKTLSPQVPCGISPCQVPLYAGTGGKPRHLTDTCKADVQSANPTCLCNGFVRQTCTSAPPCKHLSASPLMCHSGCPPEQSCISQLYASCPRSRNAMHTLCDSSQATRTFNYIPSIIICCSCAVDERTFKSCSFALRHISRMISNP